MMKGRWGMGAAVGLLLAGGAVASAADSRAMRIYMVGNSLTDNVWYDGFQKLAESRGHTHTWGRSMTPGAPIFWHWDHDPAFTQAPFGPYRKALVDYEWDAVTFQPFNNYRQEFDALQKFLDLMQAKNAQAQVYIYAQWMGRGRGDFGEIFDGPPGADKAKWYSSSSIRAFYDQFVAEVRATRPDMKPARLIPAGHALALLDQKIKAGQAPGLKSIWDLYNDGIHLNNVGAYVAGLSFFAVIYAESPIGLPDEPYQPGGAHHGIRLTPELTKVLQETVWETVATEPLTGVMAKDPLRVVTPALPDATAGKPYEMRMLPAFGGSPYRWAVASGALPAGLTLSEAGVIGGAAPAQAGRCAVTLQVTDAKSTTATRDLTLAVVPDTKPVIGDAPLPPLRQGEYVHHTFAAAGGNGTLRWSAGGNRNEPELPIGLILLPDGTLAGTPVRTGSFPVTLRAADSDRGTPDEATKQVTLTVGPAGPDVLFVRRVPKDAVTVDGKLDEADWKLEQAVAKAVAGPQADGVTARFGVLATDENLYVAVEVKDAAVGADDGVDIFVDALHNRETVYNADDRWIHVTPTGAARIVGDRRGIKTAAKQTADGYVVEASLGRLGLGVKLSDSAVGLDIGVTKGSAKLVWHGTKDNDTDPSQFGTVLFPAREEKAK